MSSGPILEITETFSTFWDELEKYNRNINVDTVIQTQGNYFDGCTTFIDAYYRMNKFIALFYLRWFKSRDIEPEKLRLICNLVTKVEPTTGVTNATKTTDIINQLPDAIFTFKPLESMLEFYTCFLTVIPLANLLHPRAQTFSYFKNYDPSITKYVKDDKTFVFYYTDQNGFEERTNGDSEPPALKDYLPLEHEKLNLPELFIPSLITWMCGHIELFASYKTVPALPDGNCLLNAIVLAQHGGKLADELQISYAATLRDAVVIFINNNRKNYIFGGDSVETYILANCNRVEKNGKYVPLDNKYKLYLEQYNRDHETNEQHITFEVYRYTWSQNATWGSHIETLFISCIIKRPVVAIQNSSDKDPRPIAQFEPLFVHHLITNPEPLVVKNLGGDGGVHYDALVPPV